MRIIKNSLIFIITIVVYAPSIHAREFAAFDGKNGSRFMPVWNDEFDGTEVDTSKWNVFDEWPDMDFPWRRNWKPSNVSVHGGSLLIRTISEAGGDYSTGAIRSGDYGPSSGWKFGQAYGCFEARMKPPRRQGHWSAFWIFTPEAGGVDGSGRDGTEIDIVEFAYVNADIASHALHWDGYGSAHQSSSKQANGFNINDGNWHVVTLEWYPDEYVFYVDGNETWRTADGGVSQVPSYIKLTDEIGNYGTGPAGWGTGPIQEANLPDSFHVDYVRVWSYEASSKLDGDHTQRRAGRTLRINGVPGNNALLVGNTGDVSIRLFTPAGELSGSISYSPVMNHKNTLSLSEFGDLGKGLYHLVAVRNGAVLDATAITVLTDDRH